MVDNNRERSHIAMRPVLAFVEYVFFISLGSYHMLLLSCRLHNWQPPRLALPAMRKSVRKLIFIAVTHPITKQTTLDVSIWQSFLEAVAAAEPAAAAAALNLFSPHVVRRRRRLVAALAHGKRAHLLLLHVLLFVTWNAIH
jgi:hypothetical protein